jgi:hypothetical protein
MRSVDIGKADCKKVLALLDACLSNELTAESAEGCSILHPAVSPRQLSRYSPDLSLVSSRLTLEDNLAVSQPLPKALPFLTKQPGPEIFPTKSSLVNERFDTGIQDKR